MSMTYWQLPVKDKTEITNQDDIFFNPISHSPIVVEPGQLQLGSQLPAKPLEEELCKIIFALSLVGMRCK